MIALLPYQTEHAKRIEAALRQWRVALDASDPGTGSSGSLKRLRLRTLGDELADAVSQKPRPTTRAIRMANALMLERILGSGQFRSPAALASRLGISRSIISNLLAVLNLPPSEIEHVLFETA